MGQKKPPIGGGATPPWGRLIDVATALEAHNAGHRGQVRVQIRMEGCIVVVDGAIGVLEPVSGENAHHDVASWQEPRPSVSTDRQRMRRLPVHRRCLPGLRASL